MLVPKLVARGHRVRVLDLGYFGMSHLRRMQDVVEIVREDIRRVCRDRAFAERLLDGCDCVIHLAALSNDPSADLNPQLTEEVNLDATKALALAARARGIRFVLSSSAAVYGNAEDEVDEDGAVAPMTTYAKSKLRAEQFLESLAGEGWKPVILRCGTLHGYSPRMRFDLVVNVFALYGALYNRIRIFGRGLQWRPFLHVADCARAFVHFAEKPTLRHVRYNIANENLRVIDVAHLFRRLRPCIRVEQVEAASQEDRTYRVCTERMRAEGFVPRVTVEEGAEEVMEALVSGAIPDPESLYYQNAKWLAELRGIGPTESNGLVELAERLIHEGRVPQR